MSTSQLLSRPYSQEVNYDNFIENWLTVFWYLNKIRKKVSKFLPHFMVVRQISICGKLMIEIGFSSCFQPFFRYLIILFAPLIYTCDTTNAASLMLHFKITTSLVGQSYWISVIDRELVLISLMNLDRIRLITRKTLKKPNEA